jgi:hypothetical protein
MFACQDHCSGGSSGQRQQGRIRRSRSRRLPRQPLPTGDCPRGVHPPTTTRDRRRPRAHPAYGWWPRRWPASPTAAAGSHQERPAWTSVTAGTWRSMGRTGSCKVELVDRRHSRTRARTRAEARASIFRCGGARVTDHLLVLGIAGGGRTVTDPSAVRPLTLEIASAGGEPKKRAAFLGKAATRRASMVAPAS